MQIEHAPIAFIDNDHSQASRELIYSFHEPWFAPYGIISGPREGQQLLDSGKVMAVLDIPPQFEQSLLLGDPKSVQLQLDASNSEHRRNRGRICVDVVAAIRTEPTG